MKAEIRRALSKRSGQALVTLVGGAALINPAMAQQQQAMEELEEIVVTGLRGSLKASMDIKRDAVGVVDAISAEDIGKFPDANLSEALQRITGVSIDRRNGEGALVTARGFGAQFNMVTLNGRQMPTADAFAGGALIAGGIGGNARSFNFANLAAESVSALEVYKTGRADIATGGIGASINVRTARPLDNDGLVVNVGTKAVNDTTNRVGSDVTPEISGIFSFDVVRTIGVEHMPAIVFVTAHDRYAIQAFELNAIDYLLKPVSRERFEETVKRVQTRLANSEHARRALDSLLQSLAAPRKYLARLAIRTAGKTYFVNMDDVDWLRAAENYVQLHVGAARHLVHLPMQSLEESLDPAKFLRIHRSFIVNVT